VPKKSETLESAQAGRRDEALRRALAMPPKLHKSRGLDDSVQERSATFFASGRRTKGVCLQKSVESSDL
jgi:hypothetical protein